MPQTDVDSGIAVVTTVAVRMERMVRSRKRVVPQRAGRTQRGVALQEEEEEAEEGDTVIVVTVVQQGTLMKLV
jgi:hypothetical protein